MDKVQEGVKVKGNLYNNSTKGNRAKEEGKGNKAQGKRNEATEKDNKLNKGMRIKAQKKGRRQLGVLYFRVELCTPYTSLCLVVPSQESHACECFSVNYGLGGALPVGTSMYMVCRRRLNFFETAWERWEQQHCIERCDHQTLHPSTLDAGARLGMIQQKQGRIAHSKCLHQR